MGGKVFNLGGGGGGGKVVGPEKLVITAQPSKTDYKVGDTFSANGMTVELYYANGAHMTLDSSGYVISPAGPLEEEDEAVTVSYTEFGKTVSATVSINVTRTEIPVPTQNNVLTYSGSAQQPTWDHYDATKMSKSGSESEVDAGTYTVTFTCNDAYTFPEGEHSKAVEWKIARAECEPSAKPVSVTLSPEHLSETITITRQGDGVISAQSMDPDIVDVEVAENVITVTSKGQQSGKADITVTVAKTKNYNEGTLVIPVNAAFTRVWGVMWDYSNTNTAMTRLTKDTDPNGLVTEGELSAEPQAAVGNTGGSSPFDEWMPWAGMVEYNVAANGAKTKTGAAGFSRANDTMVFIPKFWCSVKDDAANKKRYYYVADGAKSGFVVHPGSNCYVGRYNTGSGYVSKTGVAPLVNIKRPDARTGSAAKGSRWQQYDYAAWNAIWLLYLVEFADWDSQTKIGQGNVNASSAINSGGTDTMTYHTGRADGTDGRTAVQYRHIENPWGNVFEWIDGVNFDSSGKVYVCATPANFKDDTAEGYTEIGTKAQSDGYIKSLGISANMPWAFFPSATGGSATTYIPDYAGYYSGWRVLRVGGRWNRGSYAGLFYFNASSGSSSYDSDIGARLLYRDP